MGSCAPVGRVAHPQDRRGCVGRRGPPSRPPTATRGQTPPAAMPPWEPARTLLTTAVPRARRREPGHAHRRRGMTTRSRVPARRGGRRRAGQRKKMARGELSCGPKKRLLLRWFPLRAKRREKGNGPKEEERKKGKRFFLILKRDSNK